MVVVAKLRDDYNEADLASMLERATASTADDVSVTKSGRRLDSAQALLAFIDELHEQGPVAQRR